MKFLIIYLLISIGVGSVVAQDKLDLLFPSPKNIEIQDKVFSPNGDRILVQKELYGDKIKDVAALINKSFDCQCEVVAGVVPGEQTVMSVYLDPLTIKEEQGYRLSVNEHNIELVAHDEAGAYYGLLTLEQALQLTKGKLNCLRIIDSPDFNRRGVMLDISRDKVPSMKTLKEMIGCFASWKINEIQLYVEHTFAYKNHKQVWENASPVTAAEILELDEFCKERHIDLVPNQNSLGHMGRWLKHEPYFYLSERPDNVESDNWIIDGRRITLCAVAQEPIEFMDSLYAEYLPNFSSKYFNVGGDEPYELGYGRSAAACEKYGKGTVYLDYMKKINKRVHQYGKQTQMWGDIVNKHPELIPQMPKDIICMVWGYRPTHPYDTQCKRFDDEDIPFYVCPGTSSWRSFIGRTETAKQNLINAAVNGKKYKAIGYLNTDWGDKGHMQPISASYPAFVYGAGLAWSVEENKEADLAALMNQYMLKEEDATLAKALLRLTNAYLGRKDEIPVGTPYFNVLEKTTVPFDKDYTYKKYDMSLLETVREEIAASVAMIDGFKPTNEESKMVVEEIRTSAQLADWGCRLLQARAKAKDNDLYKVSFAKRKKLAQELQDIIEIQQKMWKLRNRNGGLNDSIERLEKVIKILNTKKPS
ncbi:beta-hexosaminidase [Puteibacter caeruleilacunae]|nr:beta-hexosaminidase [Puteibacter caeruleilacunae]